MHRTSRSIVTSAPFCTHCTALVFDYSTLQTIAITVARSGCKHINELKKKKKKYSTNRHCNLLLPPVLKIARLYSLDTNNDRLNL